MDAFSWMFGVPADIEASLANVVTASFRSGIHDDSITQRISLSLRGCIYCCRHPVDGLPACLIHIKMHIT